MSPIYIVMTSNCESYEDYHESINSVWTDRDVAVAHIEKGLGMTQVGWANPERPHTRDRWERDDSSYPRREDFEDEEEWLDCFNGDGKLMPLDDSRTDAWIEVYNLNPVPFETYLSSEELDEKYDVGIEVTD